MQPNDLLAPFVQLLQFLVSSVFFIHARFDIIAQEKFILLYAKSIVFDRDYLCGPRSDDYVLIAITAGRQRDTQTKQAFYRRLTDLLEKSPGIRRQDVMVVINTNESGEWSFGDGIATMVVDV